MIYGLFVFNNFKNSDFEVIIPVLLFNKVKYNRSFVNLVLYPGYKFLYPNPQGALGGTHIPHFTDTF